MLILYVDYSDIYKLRVGEETDPVSSDGLALPPRDVTILNYEWTLFGVALYRNIRNSVMGPNKVGANLMGVIRQDSQRKAHVVCQNVQKKA